MPKNIFKPDSEKFFVAAMTFVPVIPLILYVVLNYFLDLNATEAGSLLSAIAFMCYSFISLFAIPFEGVMEILGLMRQGGGMFEYKMMGIDFIGILLVQGFYACAFYVFYSIRTFLRKGNKFKQVLTRN